MAATVQVLCPNGRRQNIKINPNTKLLEILEEVCQRQGYIPAEDYKLVQAQGRKDLDLSLSVRFSSLPNNAKLELIKCTSTRVEQDVTIALQLDSGQRLQDSFKPSANLWDILLHLENANREFTNRLTFVDKNQIPALHPVCIFMREEIIGESALTSTTLKKLGLTSGKAIIRLLHRPIEESTLNEIADKIEKEKQKQSKLEEIALKKCELRQMDEEERNRKFNDSELIDIKEETSECFNMETESVADSRCKVDSSEPMQEDFHETSSGLEHRSGQSSLSVQGQSSERTSAVDDLRNLNISGVEIFTPEDFQSLTPQEQAIAQRLLQRYLPAMQPDTSANSTENTSASQSQSPEPIMPFADFRFPEETRGMDLTGSTLLGNSQENLQPCDREPLLFNAGEPLQSSSVNSDDIPEDFFEVTQSDVRKMYRDLQNTVRQLEDEPLMTKAMKRAQAEAMFDQYDRIVIRVQFPDRLTLQGLFRPREQVSSLYAFVREHLDDSRESFYLYTTPPKEILKDKTLSLAASHLAPAALVHCGSESHKDHLLSEKSMSKIVHRLEAEQQVARVMNPHLDATALAQLSATSSPHSSTVASTSHAGVSGSTRKKEPSPSASSAPTTLPSGAQVPKWLKLSKK